MIIAQAGWGNPAARCGAVRQCQRAGHGRPAWWLLKMTLGCRAGKRSASRLLPLTQFPGQARRGSGYGPDYHGVHLHPTPHFHHLRAVLPALRLYHRHHEPGTGLERRHAGAGLQASGCWCFEEYSRTGGAGLNHVPPQACRLLFFNVRFQGFPRRK